MFYKRWYNRKLNAIYEYKENCRSRSYIHVVFRSRFGDIINYNQCISYTCLCCRRAISYEYFALLAALLLKLPVLYVRQLVS